MDPAMHRSDGNLECSASSAAGVSLRHHGASLESWPLSPTPQEERFETGMSSQASLGLRNSSVVSDTDSKTPDEIKKLLSIERKRLDSEDRKEHSVEDSISESSSYDENLESPYMSGGRATQFDQANKTSREPVEDETKKLPSIERKRLDSEDGKEHRVKIYLSSGDWFFFECYLGMPVEQMRIAIAFEINCSPQSLNFWRHKCSPNCLEARELCGDHSELYLLFEGFNLLGATGLSRVECDSRFFRNGHLLCRVPVVWSDRVNHLVLTTERALQIKERYRAAAHQFFKGSKAPNGVSQSDAVTVIGDAELRGGEADRSAAPLASSEGLVGAGPREVHDKWERHSDLVETAECAGRKRHSGGERAWEKLGSLNFVRLLHCKR